MKWLSLYSIQELEVVVVGDVQSNRPSEVTSREGPSMSSINPEKDTDVRTNQTNKTSAPQSVHRCSSHSLCGLTLSLTFRYDRAKPYVVSTIIIKSSSVIYPSFCQLIHPYRTHKFMSTIITENASALFIATVLVPEKEEGHQLDWLLYPTPVT
jgi:hypothetical protein